MAYRESLKSTRTLAMFAPAIVVERVETAIAAGQTVEMEYTSFNDPGPDECRVIVEGTRIFTIPGY